MTSLSDRLWEVDPRGYRLRLELVGYVSDFRSVGKIAYLQAFAAEVFFDLPHTFHGPHRNGFILAALLSKPEPGLQRQLVARYGVEHGNVMYQLLVPQLHEYFAKASMITDWGFNSPLMQWVIPCSGGPSGNLVLEQALSVPLSWITFLQLGMAWISQRIGRDGLVDLDTRRQVVDDANELTPEMIRCLSLTERAGQALAHEFSMTSELQLVDAINRRMHELLPP